MKNLMLLLIIFSGYNSYSQKAIDKKYGFKDIRFEMNADSLFRKISAIKSKDSDKEFSIYNITDPMYLRIGDCKLVLLKVYAFNNKVDFITIKTEKSQFPELKAILFQMFGKGFKSNSYIEKYAWLGNRVTGILDEDVVDNSATFSMQSKAGNKSFTEYMKTHAKKGAADF